MMEAKNGLLLNLQVRKEENKSSRAIKLACHQDLSKARLASNFGPEATGQLRMKTPSLQNVYIYKKACEMGSVPMLIP